MSCSSQSTSLHSVLGARSRGDQPATANRLEHRQQLQAGLYPPKILRRGPELPRDREPREMEQVCWLHACPSTGARQRPLKRSDRCQRAPPAGDGRGCELTACTSNPRRARAGSVWRPMKPLAPVTSTRFMALAAGRGSQDTCGRDRSSSACPRARRCRTQGRPTARHGRGQDCSPG